MLNTSKPANQRILAIGLATVDLISLLPTFPRANSRVVAQEMSFGGGGPAATAAVALSRLGHTVEVVTSVGADQMGEMVLHGLNLEGVNTKAIIVSPEGTTSVSQVVVNSETRERLIVTKPGSGIEEAVANFDFNIPKSWIHLDQSGYAALVETGKRDFVFKNHLVSIDGGNRIENLNLENVELYAPTIDELRNIYGAALTPRELLQSALASGAKTVVATDGADGSYSLENGELIHASAFTGPIYSTLGAGDVFHGALLASLINGDPIISAMKSANLAAFISCNGLDGRSAIPTLEELQKAMETISRSESK